MLGRVFDNSRIFLRLDLCPTQLLIVDVNFSVLLLFFKTILAVSWSRKYTKYGLYQNSVGSCFILILEMKKGCFVVGYMIRKANLHTSCFRLQSDYCSWYEQCLLHFQPQTISQIVLKANIDICCKFKCKWWDFVVFS